MKKVIFVIAAIVLSAGAVVATTGVAKAKTECSSCTSCDCPFCTDDCCSK